MKQRIWFGVVCIVLVLGKETGFGQHAIDSFILEGKKQLAQAVDHFDEEEIIRARSIFERILLQQQKRDLIHYYIGLADYRLATMYYNSNAKKADQYLDDGIAHLEKAVALNKKFADAYALLSSLYGQKIGVDPAAAMTLGPQSGIAMEKAKKLAPENPRVLMLEAISTYFAPEQYGGDKTRGMDRMEKAIAIFRQEKIADPLLPDWGYEDALMMQATWKLAANEIDTATTLIEEALKVNPHFGWAISMKDSLRRLKHRR